MVFKAYCGFLVWIYFCYPRSQKHGDEESTPHVLISKEASIQKPERLLGAGFLRKLLLGAGFFGKLLLD